MRRLRRCNFPFPKMIQKQQTSIQNSLKQLPRQSSNQPPKRYKLERVTDITDSIRRSPNLPNSTETHGIRAGRTKFQTQSHCDTVPFTAKRGIDTIPLKISRLSEDFAMNYRTMRKQKITLNRPQLLGHAVERFFSAKLIKPIAPRAPIAMIVCAWCLVAISGCAQKPAFLGAQAGNSQSTVYGPNRNLAANNLANAKNMAALDQKTNAMTAQMRALNDRLGATDTDNKDLIAQIASLQQQLDLAKQEKQLFQQQLKDTSGKLREAQAAGQAASSRLNVMRASTGFTGATIRANNSLAKQLEGIKSTGVEVWQDGDVVRIDLPTDRLFVQGTYQLQPNGATLLDQVAGQIKRNFPRQIVVIEGHTDNVPISGTVATLHQISATQSLSIFNYLARGGYLPVKQMQTMGFGNNRPRFSNGDAAGRAKNRRIEIVIYPETYDN